MQFHKEELGNLVDWNNLKSMTFDKIECMVMHIKNMCILIYGRFAVSCLHDAALKTESRHCKERPFH